MRVLALRKRTPRSKRPYQETPERLCFLVGTLRFLVGIRRKIHPTKLASEVDDNSMSCVTYCVTFTRHTLTAILMRGARHFLNAEFHVTLYYLIVCKTLNSM